jgi:hypothetical protein
MKTFRLLFHSFTLALIDIGAILAGFGIYTLARSAPQLAVQVPAAVLIAILSFFLWSLLIGRWCPRKLFLESLSELVGVWFLALLWSPTLFIPLHYLGRGYLTSWANIWNLWLFQMPVNVLALVVAWRLTKTKRYG